MQAIILAGGLGTRLRPLTNQVPKAMVKANGKPFLEYELLLLKSKGISDFVISVSYLAHVVTDYFKDGSQLGIKIKYSYDGDEQLGAAGAIKKAEPLLTDIFFVTYGDAYLRADYVDAMSKFSKRPELGMMMVYKNQNEHGKSDLVVEDGLVTAYDKKRMVEKMNWINYGVSLLRKDSLGFIPADTVCGEEQFYGDLIKEKQLLAYEVYDRFYEIGSPSSLNEFEQFLIKSGST